MSEQLEQRRLVRLLICGLSFAGCAGTVLVTCCFSFALTSFRDNFNGPQIATATASAVSALSAVVCLSAMPLLVRRSRHDFERPLRALVSFLCAFAAVMNVVAFGLAGLAFGAAPALAAISIWITPTPLPPYCCHKCGYDLRGTPVLNESPLCPECGCVRLSREVKTSW